MQKLLLIGVMVLLAVSCRRINQRLFTPDQYCYYNVAGHADSLITPKDTAGFFADSVHDICYMSFQRLIDSADVWISDKEIILSFPLLHSGTTPFSSISTYSGGFTSPAKDAYFGLPAHPLSLTYTRYDLTVDGYVEGYFSGLVFPDSSGTGGGVPITGNFRIHQHDASGHY